MSKDTYESHLPTRPEMADYTEEAKLTIEDPDVIMRDKDGCHHHYKLGLGREKFKNCYVRVLVHYRRRWGRKEGIVASYWLCRRIGKGELIWMTR